LTIISDSYYFKCSHIQSSVEQQIIG